MKVIAKRLGLPESQVVPADELSSVFSVISAKDPNKMANKDTNSGTVKLTEQETLALLKAPRDEWIDDLNEPEFDSDDDLWSNDDDAAGDYDEKYLPNDSELPETMSQAAKLRRIDWLEKHDDKDNMSVPANIPYLNLPEHGTKVTKGMYTTGDDDEKTVEEVMVSSLEWRRLPIPVLKEGFLTIALQPHTMGCIQGVKTSSKTCNSFNTPTFLMPISPVDACKYIPTDFTLEVETIFVPDVKRDLERALATVERNIRIEEELARNVPTDELLLFGEAKQMTTVDAFLARQHKEDQSAVADVIEIATAKALLAAKSTNMADMEDALDEQVPVNTTDDFGNTLLILAAQQGSKRMCKFLLRRGATMNLQNLYGNTCLHFCYAYSHVELAEYLKIKVTTLLLFLFLLYLFAFIVQNCFILLFFIFNFCFGCFYFCQQRVRTMRF